MSDQQLGFRRVRRVDRINGVIAGILIEQAYATQRAAELVGGQDDIMSWFEWEDAKSKLRQLMDDFGVPRSCPVDAGNDALLGRPAEFVRHVREARG